MNLAWSFAKLSCMHMPLLDALSAAAMPTIPEFDALALNKMAWACAVFELHDPPLLQAISAEALARISEFDVQERLNMLWAFADFSFGIPSNSSTLIGMG